jgi:hypothetical protein
MPSLRDTQIAFSAALRSGEAGALASLLVDDGIAPQKRLQIYRNNHRLAVLGVMQASYPVIERLGGAGWFRHSVSQYQDMYPSRSGDRQHLGEKYPDFLRAALAGTSHVYFADVAALEWAYQCVLTAEERAPVDLAVLQAFAPQDHERLVFVPRPALRLVESEFPIFAIWHAHQPSVPEVPEIRLDAGRCRVLLIRRKDHVELRELSEGSSQLLQQWLAGTPLRVAAAAVAATVQAAGAAEFDVAGSLRELLSLETVADVVCADERDCSA